MHLKLIVQEYLSLQILQKAASEIVISLGSCFEAETQLLIFKALGIEETKLTEETLALLVEKENMLTAFAKSLLAKC